MKRCGMNMERCNIQSINETNRNFIVSFMILLLVCIAMSWIESLLYCKVACVKLQRNSVGIQHWLQSADSNIIRYLHYVKNRAEHCIIHFQIKMIGVQEDLLNMFLVSHGLLLLTNLILGLLFFVFLCVRHHPAFKDNYRYLPTAAYNWFYSRGGAQDQVYVEQPKRRRRLGIFGRN